MWNKYYSFQSTTECQQNSRCWNQIDLILPPIKTRKTANKKIRMVPLEKIWRTSKNYEIISGLVNCAVLLLRRRLYVATNY